MDIKNLAREVLDMDLYFPWLKGIDRRIRFERQVNFAVWLRNGFFHARTDRIPSKRRF